MNLNTPPPSYEAATGIQAGQNPYFHNVLIHPTAPFNDDLMSASNTVPILSQQFGRRQSPQIRPRIPEPQTNTILRRQESKVDRKTCVCFFVILTFMIGLIICLVLLVRSMYGYFNSQKELSLQQNHDKLWPNVKKRIDESKWNFQTVHTAQEND